MSTRVIFDCAEMGVDYADSGAWRSYHLDAAGDTEAELLASAHVWEIDQDGGELGGYPLEDAPRAVEDAGRDMIRRALAKARADDEADAADRRIKERKEETVA